MGFLALDYFCIGTGSELSKQSGAGGKSIITTLTNSDAITLELIFNHMGPLQ